MIDSGGHDGRGQGLRSPHDIERAEFRIHPIEFSAGYVGGHLEFGDRGAPSGADGLPVEWGTPWRDHLERGFTDCEIEWDVDELTGSFRLDNKISGIGSF
jgi:hypothetical protein